MIVRPATRADREAIAEIISRIDNFNADDRACALEVLDLGLAPGGNDYLLLVADDAGTVAGYVCYGPTPMTRSTYDLYWIATDPVARRRGVSAALVGAMEADLRARGGRRVRIETSSLPSYDPARAFFVAAGYPEIIRVADFYADGDDLCIHLKRF